MKAKDKWNVLLLLLEKANAGVRTVSEKEICGVVSARDLFEEDADTDEILEELEGERLICESGKGVFRIIADIAALRNAVLAFSDKSQRAEAEPQRAPVSLDKILGSEWVISDGAQEMRNIVFKIHRAEESQNDRDSVDLDALDEDDKEDGEGIPPEVDAVFQGLKEGISMTGEHHGERYLVLNRLEIDGKEVGFKIVTTDDGVYFSDDGYALYSLSSRVPLADNGNVNSRISSIIRRYQIEMIGTELIIKVGSAENALSYLLKLFAAMERIVTIDEDEVVASAEYSREKNKIWDMMREILSEAPDSERDDVIRRMRERYQAVKDGENVDDILLYAKAVKWFSDMTEEDYSVSRDYLMKEILANKPQVDIDPVYLKALSIVVQTRQASVSLIQRKCGIRYNHAGKIIEWMECMGYISPFDGKRQREVYLTKKEYIERFGPLNGEMDHAAENLSAWEREERKIKDMIAAAPQKREDLTISLGAYSTFGAGVRLYIDYGKDIAYKRENSENGVTVSLLTDDIPALVHRIREIVSSWEHEMVNNNILDGMSYHVTFYKNGIKEADYQGQNKFPNNFADFINLLWSSN